MARSLRAPRGDVNDVGLSSAGTFERLRGWFDSSLGRSLQAVEAHRLREALAPLYGTVALQLGRIGQFDLLDASAAATRLLLDPRATTDGYPHERGAPEQKFLAPRACPVRGAFYDLPFECNSIDTVLLPHTLDFVDDPHQVLREVSRVLVPEGHMVILGFNNLSLWGARRVMTKRPRPVPWCGNFFSLARVTDWLSLLDFECASGGMLYYRPPFTRETWIERSYFMEQAGDRWWPLASAVYLIVAKKRVVGMTPMRLEWKVKRSDRAVATATSSRLGHRRQRYRRHG